MRAAMSIVGLFLSIVALVLCSVSIALTAAEPAATSTPDLTNLAGVWKPAAPTDPKSFWIRDVTMTPRGDGVMQVELDGHNSACVWWDPRPQLQYLVREVHDGQIVREVTVIIRQVGPDELRVEQHVDVAPIGDADAVGDTATELSFVRSN